MRDGSESTHIVCVMPIRFGAADREPGPVIHGGAGWASADWSRWFPDQFRASFEGTRIFKDPIRLPAAALAPELTAVAAPTSLVAVFDGRLGVFVVTFEVDLKGVPHQRIRDIYLNLCTLQEKQVAPLIATALAISPGSFSLTWGFSINILRVQHGVALDAELLRQFNVLCGGNAMPEAPGQQADDALIHLVGSTGSLAVVGSANPPQLSWRRVLGLWSAFYCYYCTSLTDFARLSRIDVRPRRKLGQAELLEEIAANETRHNTLLQRMSLFDPANVCTREFDEEVYDGCWQRLSVERVSTKLERLSSFFIQNAREAQAELTRRYEVVVQGVLFLLAFTQLVPIFQAAVAAVAPAPGPDASTDGAFWLPVGLAAGACVAAYLYAKLRSRQ
ncbi:MAG: hypothetical protein KF723_00955 [Rhizobiaceae bacterium]|nr:hypothetical protein [Rhizobiaceae bacterium]